MSRSGIDCDDWPQAWDDWPQAWQRFMDDKDAPRQGLTHGRTGPLARCIQSIPGVFGATVRQEQRVVRPPTPESFSSVEDYADLAAEIYPCIVVDLEMRPPGWLGSQDWEVWGENVHWKDLVVFHRVGQVLDDSIPTSVCWEIKQQKELMMSKNGRETSLRELRKKMPALDEGVMRLMEHLDLWTLRSMQVDTDEHGNFKSQWDPTLAPKEARPTNLESWTVLLLEFVMPSQGAEEFTALARTIQKSASKLGTAGSLTHKLEETVRTVSQENDEVKWAAAAYKAMAERAVELAYDALVSMRSGAVPKVLDQNIMDELVLLRKRLEQEDMTNVGAVFHQRFLKVERAAHERRPEVAADLLRDLEDE